MQNFISILFFFGGWAQLSPCGWAGPNRPNRVTGLTWLAVESTRELIHACMTRLSSELIIIHLLLCWTNDAACSYSSSLPPFLPRLILVFLSWSAQIGRAHV